MGSLKELSPGWCSSAARRGRRDRFLDPGWVVDGDGEALVRTYHLPSLRASGLFVQLVLEVGEQIDYVPDVDVRYLEVTVRISIAEGEGVGELDFRVARVLDSRL